MSYRWILTRDCYEPYIDSQYIKTDDEAIKLVNDALNYYRSKIPDTYGNKSRIQVPNEIRKLYNEQVEKLINENVEGKIKMDDCMLNSSCCVFTLKRILKERIKIENNGLFIELK